MATSPTKYDPKIPAGFPKLLTTAAIVQYTAPAEAGARILKCTLANSGPIAFDKVWYRDISAGYTDETADAFSPTAADVPIFDTDAQTEGDEFYIGDDAKFSHISFLLSTILVGATVTLVVAAWTGAAWTTLTAAADTLVDGTNVLKNTAGEISFTPPAAWATTAVNGSTMYWIRLTLATANPSTGPVASTIIRGTTSVGKVTVHRVPSGGSAGVLNRMGYELIVPPYGVGWGVLPVTFLEEHVLNAGDFLSMKCSVENQFLHDLSAIEMQD